MGRTAIEGTANSQFAYTNGSLVTTGPSTVALRATSAGNLVVCMERDTAFVTHPVGAGDYVAGQIVEISASSTANAVVLRRG